MLPVQNRCEQLLSTKARRVESYKQAPYGLGKYWDRCQFDCCPHMRDLAFIMSKMSIRKTMSSPTSCFYFNCFTELATTWIWTKITLVFSFVCFFPVSFVCAEFSTATQMPEWCRVIFSIECSVSPSWLLDCERMDGERGMNKWIKLNMLYLLSVKLVNWKMEG